MNIQQALFFSFLKNTEPIKQTKNLLTLVIYANKNKANNIVLSRYGLACKYRIISQILIYNISDKSDGLSHDELRALSSAQTANLHIM